MDQRRPIIGVADLEAPIIPVEGCVCLMGMLIFPDMSAALDDSDDEICVMLRRGTGEFCRRKPPVRAFSAGFFGNADVGAASR